MNKTLSYIFATIAILFLIKMAIDAKYYESIENSYNKELLKNQEFNIKISDLNHEVAMQKSIIVDNANQAYLLIDSIDRINIKYKNVSTFVKRINKTVIRDTFLKHDTVMYVQYKDSFIESPCSRFNDAWANISICSLDSGLMINQIEFKDTTAIVVSKHGFWNNKYTTTIVSKSPYQSTSSMNSVVVKENKTNSIIKKAGLIAVGVITALIVF
jgi:hypothetical protein